MPKLTRGLNVFAVIIGAALLVGMIGILLTLGRSEEKAAGTDSSAQREQVP
jgi:hypothetical protein